MKPCLTFVSALGLLVVGGCANYYSAPGTSVDAGAKYVKKSPDSRYHPGSYDGYHSRFQYAYRPNFKLPGEGKVVSEKVCQNPTIAKVCKRDYEIIPGAIWRYTYFSYTEKQVAQARAERFARQHDGLVEHEGTAYVVYKDVLDCEFEVTACESLVKNDEAGNTALC